MPEALTCRCANYYTPAPEHPLTVAARTWLGRDAFASGTGSADGDEGAFISEPRRYGFHATITEKGGFIMTTLCCRADSR